MDLFWIGLGLAAAGYFIGSGLQNFKSPTTPGLLDLGDEEENYKLIREKDLHWHIGISKEDARKLTEEYPDIPHITLNGSNYYQKEKVNEWLQGIGDRENS